MRRLRPLQQLLGALAVCAVALLNVAVVKSAVMQASMAVAAAPCRGEMAGMADMGGGSQPARKDAAEHRACAFCSAAAHAPVQACAPALPATTVVAWVASRTWTRLGPRGPPEREAHARGPPSRLPTT